MASVMNDRVWAGFIRQRRNLLAISLVLIFAQTANLTIDQINIFGSVLKIGEPRVVNYALWAFWGYWLYRYYVYYRDIGGSGFWNRYNEKLVKFFEQHAPDLVQFDPHVAEVLKESTFVGTSGEILPQGRTPEGWQILVRNLVLNHRKASGDNASLQFGSSTLTIPDECLRSYKFRAFHSVVFHTRLVTDYWLPYALAAMPVLIFFYGYIEI